VGKKSEQRWLWYAIDHATGTVLAYVFGKRKDDVKRLTRKTICFSKSVLMHDIVIWLLINKVELGVDIHAKLQV
jgi:IS1 family transposase